MDVDLEPMTSLPHNTANAHETVIRLHKLKDQKSIQEFYDKWSKNGAYDEHLKKDFRGPIICAETVKSHFHDKTDISILDVGAGSGFVGEELQNQGFSEVDAVEPSEGMVDMAMSKNIYRDIFKIFFTSNVDTIEANKYDAITCCGAFGKGHIPETALAEFIRIGKPGGLIVIVVSRDVYENKVTDLLEEVKQQQAAGRLRGVLVTDVPRYCHETMGLLIQCYITK